MTSTTFNKLRYGENPHQEAQIIPGRECGGIANADKLHGKDMSYNNYLDGDVAWKAVSDFKDDMPTCAIVKHATLCGLSVGASQEVSFLDALNCDRVSAYGGIIAFNTIVTLPTVRAMDKVFLEIIIAPDYTDEALALLKKRKNIRVLKAEFTDEQLKIVRSIGGGTIEQTPDIEDEEEFWHYVYGRNGFIPEHFFKDLRIAWKSCKFVKSNGIVLVKNQSTVGIGGGQPNRLKSVQIAIEQCLDPKGTVLASDGFFPFADGVELAINAGVSAIIQPGGSIRDPEIIEVAKKNNVVMIMTDKRHFFH